MRKFLGFIIGIMLLVTLGCSDNHEKAEEESQIEIEIQISTTDLIFDVNGGLQEFCITYDGNWTIINHSSWCKTDLSNGNGNSTVNVIVEASELYDDRNTNITIMGKKGNSKVLTIIQKKKDALLLTKDKYELPTGGGEFIVEVKSNISYSVVIPDEYKEWIKQGNLELARGLETNNLKFMVDVNPSTDKRNGIIVIKDNNTSLADTIYVYQAQKDELILMNDVYGVDFREREIDVELRSNVDYEVIIPADAIEWLQQIKTKIPRSDKLNFHISENLSSKERFADIIVRDKNSPLADTLYVKQYSSGIHVIHIAKAGTLNTLYTNKELFQIDCLAISGDLNADDFELIRDKMTVLTYLDLSATSITNIPNNAFYNPFSEEGRGSLKKVILPNTIISMQQSCFQGCHGLESINLPYGLQYIHDKAFQGCSGLNNITIPNSVIHLGAGVFRACHNLKQVILPNSMKSIEMATFEYCDNLKNIVIPGSITNIEDRAFAESGIEMINIPSGVTVINRSTFMGCVNLKTIELPMNLSTIGMQAFYGTGLEEIAIPGSVTIIGQSAFDNCTELTSVVLAEGINTIGKYAFYRCLKLKSINLPISLISLGEGAFYQCLDLSSIELPKSLTFIKSNTFDQSGLTSIRIPSNIASIGAAAFQDCNKLTRVDMEEGVRTIQRTAFINCRQLAIVNIPQSVYSIGEGAFGYCSSLVKIVLPDGVSHIEAGMFGLCTSLSSITIPESVKTIGEEALIGCDNLKTIIINSVQPPVYDLPDDRGFPNLNGCTLLVPRGCVENYKMTYPWNQIENIVENTGI